MILIYLIYAADWLRSTGVGCDALPAQSAFRLLLSLPLAAVVLYDQ